MALADTNGFCGCDRPRPVTTPDHPLTFCDKCGGEL